MVDNLCGTKVVINGRMILDFTRPGRTVHTKSHR